MIEVEEHGTAYFIKDNEFCGVAMLSDGGVDRENWFSIEQSPKDYKEKHRQVLIELEIENPDKYLKFISYY